MNRPHWHLDREGREERQPQPRLHTCREVVLQQFDDIERTGLPVHCHDRDQHQHGAEQRVEEELEACINAALATPNTDDDEHRDKACFKEHVEQEQIERAEHADHERFQNKESDHVFLDALVDSQPACQDAERHEESGEHDKQHGNAVNAHVVGNATTEPVNLLDHLEAWI